MLTVAALLARPSTSKDKILNFVSDVISQQEIADMLASASGRPVKPDYVSVEEAHGFIDRPETIPDRAKETRFAPEFWYIVRLQQVRSRVTRYGNHDQITIAYKSLGFFVTARCIADRARTSSAATLL